MSRRQAAQVFAGVKAEFRVSRTTENIVVVTQIARKIYENCNKILNLLINNYIRLFFISENLSLADNRIQGMRDAIAGAGGLALLRFKG